MSENSVATYRESELRVSERIALHYRAYGAESARVPVVCLHGYWRTGKDFEELAEHLAPSRQVIVPDLRGRGRSGRSEDPADYYFEQLADDVVKLLRATGIARAVFVGVALGAQLIMDLAGRSPEVVAGIVFNDSAPESVAASGHRQQAFSGGDELNFDEAMARLHGQYAETFPRMDEAGFARMLYRNYRRTDEGRFVRDFDQLTNEGLRRTAKEHPTWWNEYDRIADIPLVVLRGENSDFITPEIVTRMLQGRTAAKLHTIPGSGHPLMLWEPEVFEAIDALLAQVDAKRRA